jgi:hypothetical protein
MANWEDRLAPVVQAPKKNWEDRLNAVDLTPMSGPAESGGTVQVLNPFGANFDTGIPLSVGANNYFAGAGKSLTDYWNGLKQKVGAYSFADAQEAKKLDAPLMKTKAGKAGAITGAVAGVLPIAFVPGANTLLGAGAVGAGMGLAAPATGWGDMALNTGAGGAGGVAGNLAGRAIGAGYGLVKSTLMPFFKSGQQSIADDMLRAFTPDVQTAVGNIARDAGEIIPGSLPTAAEAAQTPGLAQLTKQVRQTPGIQAQADFVAREQANNAARVAAVRTVAGDPGQRALLEADRGAVADQLYGAARKAGIDPAALTPQALTDIAALQNRMPKEVIREAREIAKMRGEPMTDATSIDGMHWVKKALDGLIKKEAGPNGSSARLESYVGLKNDLVSTIESLSPKYASARATFEQMSKPINQMDVGQAVADKLIPAIRDFGGNANLRASGFADAMRNGDVVAQRALDMPRATMADVLGDTHMATLNALGQDLARTQNATNLARAAGSDTIQNALSQNIIRNTLGPLGLPPSLAENTLLATLLRPAQFVGSLAEPQVMNRLGQTLLSPQETVAALTRAQRQGLLTQAGKGALKYTAPIGSGLLADLREK